MHKSSALSTNTKEKKNQRNEFKRVWIAINQQRKSNEEAPERVDGREGKDEAREVEARVKEASEESRKSSGKRWIVVESQRGDTVLRSSGYGFQRRVGAEAPASRQWRREEE